MIKDSVDLGSSFIIPCSPVKARAVGTGNQQAGSVQDEAACGVKLGELLAVGKPARRNSSRST